MTRTRRLTSHAAIQAWVKYRDGQPALALRRDTTGETHPRLTLAFRGRTLPPPGMPHQCSKSNITPCSWTAWFAELDRRKLAMEVADTDEDDIHETDISFVERSAAQ